MIIQIIKIMENFQFISSWSNNYKSWKIQKEFPTKFVRYEDAGQDLFITKQIIQFINKTAKLDEK